MADDLVSVLKAELDDIKRRLAVLERPDAAQKLMLPARLSEAQAAIAQEKIDREKADAYLDGVASALDQRITKEKADREGADSYLNGVASALDSRLTQEKADRENGDSGLSGRIDAEANTRWEQDQKAFGDAAAAQTAANNAASAAAAAQSAANDAAYAASQAQRAADTAQEMARIIDQREAEHYAYTQQRLDYAFQRISELQAQIDAMKP